MASSSTAKAGKCPSPRATWSRRSRYRTGLGAEILRLWVASADYSGELFISNEILKRVVESCRRVRNTLRFLLANTSDFDAKRHAVALSDMVEIDRAIAMTGAMQDQVIANYQRYQFHLVAQRLQAFCSKTSALSISTC